MNHDDRKRAYQGYLEAARILLDPERIGPAGMHLEVPRTIAMDGAFRMPYVQGYRHAYADVMRRLKIPVGAAVNMVEGGAYVDVVLWIPKP